MPTPEVDGGSGLGRRSLNPRIEFNPHVCAGQPFIKGTRILVEVILGQLAEGGSWDSVLAGYPELTRAEIEAAPGFAEASVTRSQITKLVPAWRFMRRFLAGCEAQSRSWRQHPPPIEWSAINLRSRKPLSGSRCFESAFICKSADKAVPGFHPQIRADSRRFFPT
jgi:uncharacterized protein (DUF433 family)